MSGSLDSAETNTADSTRCEPVGPLEEPLEELVHRLSEGSEEAAEKIANHYTPHLLRVVRASLPSELRSKVDSIDLVNTLWGTMLTNPSRLAGITDPEHLMARLIRVVRNRMIDEHRKYTTCAARSVAKEEGAYQEDRDSRNQQGGVAGDGRMGGRELSPSQELVGREKLSSVIRRLNPQERTIMELRMKGLTYDQIAAAADDVSATTARRVVTSIVDQLRG